MSKRPDGTTCAARPVRRAPGFSLIELLVVISVLIILAAVALPVLGALRRASLVDNTANTVRVAVTTIRSHAGDPIGARDPEIQGAHYGGVGLSFRLDGDRLVIRPMRHDQNGTVGGSLGISQSPPRYRFEDLLNAPTYDIPTGAGVVGITIDGGSISMINPPFAIRFDADGRLIAGDGLSQRLFREGADDRTVIGAAIFAREAISPQIPTTGTLSAEQRNQVIDQGRVLMFGRYSGVDLRRGAR
ncbi:MAG: type II secretion system protein [Phycisphaeraceae bacterium]|nr:type II secretion system protein [Phycisphaeraceae bacterium]